LLAITDGVRMALPGDGSRAVSRNMMSEEGQLDAFNDVDGGKLRRQGIQDLLRPAVNLKGRLTKPELLSAYPVSARAKLHAADFLLPISLVMWALGVSRTNVITPGAYDC